MQVFGLLGAGDFYFPARLASPLPRGCIPLRTSRLAPLALAGWGCSGAGVQDTPLCLPCAALAMLIKSLHCSPPPSLGMCFGEVPFTSEQSHLNRRAREASA